MKGLRTFVGLTLMAGGLALWGVALHELLGFDAAFAAGLTDGGAARNTELTLGIVFRAVGLAPAVLAAPAFGRSLATGRERSPASTLEAVQRLEKLRNDGRLTDEEFEAAQAKLLEGG